MIFMRFSDDRFRIGCANVERSIKLALVISSRRRRLFVIIASFLAVVVAVLFVSSPYAWKEATQTLKEIYRVHSLIIPTLFDHQDRGLYPRAGNPQCINDGQCVHVMYVISQKSLFLQSYYHHPGHPQGMPLLYTHVPCIGSLRA